jgi:hypothetical protein
MSLLYFDGFEGIAFSDLSLRGWQLGFNNASGVPGSGSIVTGVAGSGLRLLNGGNVVGFGALRAYRSITPSTTVAVGCAFNKRAYTNSNDHILVSLWEGSTCHLSVTVNTAGVFKVYRGRLGTLLATSAAALYPVNTWGYLEVQAAIDNSAGFATVLLEGQQIIGATGIDTRDGATGVVDTVALDNGVNNPGTSLLATDYDDCYIVNNVGSAPWNAPLGPVRVKRLDVTGNAVTYSPEFVPSAGANWQNVDEPIADGDATYNQSAVVGDEDVFECQNITESVGAVYGVATRTRARRTDANAATLTPFVITIDENVADLYLNGTPVNLSETYQELTDIYQNNGAFTWAQASVNGLRVGYRNS